jgi:hypothetical protein
MEVDIVKIDQFTWKPWLDVKEDTGECETENSTDSIEHKNLENQTRFKCPSWQYFAYYVDLKEFYITVHEPTYLTIPALTVNPANVSVYLWEIPYLITGWPHLNTMADIWGTSYYDNSEMLEIINQKTRSEELLDYLESQGILIPRRSEVCEYLVYHPDMLEILPSICKAVINEFSRDAQMSLEVYSDPEIDHRYLTIYVRQKEYTEQILERISGVRAGFSRKLAEKRGRVLITTDFDNPL